MVKPRLIHFFLAACEASLRANDLLTKRGGYVGVDATNITAAGPWAKENAAQLSALGTYPSADIPVNGAEIPGLF